MFVQVHFVDVLVFVYTSRLLIKYMPKTKYPAKEDIYQYRLLNVRRANCASVEQVRSLFHI